MLDLKSCLERVEEKLHTVDHVSYKLANLEKLVMGLYRPGGW